MACAPMPSPRYSPKPYSEAKRSLSSRASFSSGTTFLASMPLNSSQARSSSSTRSSCSSWTSFLRCSMSSTISRTFSAQASICRCSSRDILPSPLRHRSLARPRRSFSSSPRCSAPSRTTSASRPLPSERALSNSLAPRSPARAVFSSPSSSAASSPARYLMALSKRVRARPFSAPLPPSAESSVPDRAASASPATADTSSRSLGPSRRSSRTARLCMSSRTFLASVASIFEATSRSRPFAMSRAATRSKPSFSAHRLSMRAQYSSSSSKSSSDADTKYARRRTRRSATRSTSSVRSASSCSRSARIRPSRSARSASRFSWSTRVQMCAAK